MFSIYHLLSASAIYTNPAADCPGSFGGSSSSIAILYSGALDFAMVSATLHSVITESIIGLVAC